MQIINSIIHKVADRAIHLVVDPNSPLNEIKDALFEFMKYIGQVEDAHKAQQAKEAEENKLEQVKEEQKPEGQ